MTAREVKMEPNLNDPKAVSDAGERIYDERYRQDYERDYRGQVVAVDVLSGNATLGGTSSAALLKARHKYPKAVFHLIRVGHAGSFEVGTAYRHVHTDRLPGRQRPS